MKLDAYDAAEWEEFGPPVPAVGPPAGVGARGAPVPGRPDGGARLSVEGTEAGVTWVSPPPPPPRAPAVDTSAAGTAVAAALPGAAHGSPGHDAPSPHVFRWGHGYLACEGRLPVSTYVGAGALPVFE